MFKKHIYMTVAEKEQVKALMKRYGMIASLANLQRKTQRGTQTKVDRKSVKVG